MPCLARSLIPTLLLSLSTAGCAIVSSQKLGPAAQAPTGVPYMLPKALLPIEVVANGPQIRVDVLEPVFVGDPQHAYALHYNANAFSTDDVKLEVVPRTSLLKSLTLTSTDQTGEVLKKLVSTALQAESAAGAGDVVLMQSLLDPDDASQGTQLATRIDAAIRPYLSAQREACAGGTASDGCAELRQVGEPAAAVSVRLAAGSGTPALLSTPPADCGAGICHRASLPYQVEMSLFGRTRSTLVLLPNGGPVLALPLQRQAFVTVKHTVVLSNGVVQKYDADKPSSALALVSWPLDVYEAVVDTTSKIVQLKIDTSRNSLALQKQLVDEAQERKALEERLKELGEPKPEAAGLVAMGGRRGALLTLAVGRPTTALPGGGAAKPTTGGLAPAPAAPAPAAAASGAVRPGSDGQPGTTR